MKSKRVVKVKRTILGKGVFAKRSFKPDKIVGEICGDIMNSDFESDYCMHLDRKTVLEPVRPFRFLNHNCTPNCELLLWKRRKGAGKRVRRLWLRTIRRVKKGEQLTIDYAWPADAAIPCLCTSERCRKWIVAEADLPKLLRRNMSA